MNALRSAVARADALLESQERESRLRDAQARVEAEQNAEDLSRFLRFCRRAAPQDYADWLRGYIRHGGLITHPRPYPLPANWWFFEPADGAPATLPTLYGAQAISLIVPADADGHTSLHYGAVGHNRIYRMGTFSAARGACVELFTDVRELLLSDEDE